MPKLHCKDSLERQRFSHTGQAPQPQLAEPEFSFSFLFHAFSSWLILLISVSACIPLTFHDSSNCSILLFCLFVSVGICSIFVFLPGSTSYSQIFRYTIKDDQNHAPS
jgi:hypothetical protein